MTTPTPAAGNEEFRKLISSVRSSQRMILRDDPIGSVWKMGDGGKRELVRIHADGDNYWAITTEELDQLLRIFAAQNNATYEAVMKLLEEKCTCSCNFGDGCLCSGDNSLRAELRESIAKIYGRGE